MRQLILSSRRRIVRPSARGFTMIELIVVMAIFAIIATASIPMLSDYSTNSRLREGGNLLLADALFAQSEALKRNSPVAFAVSSTTLQVTDVQRNETLRTREIPSGLSMTVGTVTFGGAGRPAVFGTSAQVDVGLDSVTCSSQLRCPRLLVDGGGGVRLCGNKLDCGSL